MSSLFLFHFSFSASTQLSEMDIQPVKKQIQLSQKVLTINPAWINSEYTASFTPTETSRGSCSCFSSVSEETPKYRRAHQIHRLGEQTVLKLETASTHKSTKSHAVNIFCDSLP